MSARALPSPLVSAPPAPAPVVWITGLSGTGKSTLARALAASLRRVAITPLLLDGDEFRAAAAEDLGHSPADRLTSALRLVRLAELACRQGIPTIVATMSLFNAVHDEVRARLPLLRVVYLHAPLEFLAARDAKGLYAGARRGTRDNVVGIHQAFDPPPNPDLDLEVSSHTDLFANVHRVRALLTEWLPTADAHTAPASRPNSP